MESISNWKIVWNFLFGGGVTGVIDYLLDVLNRALQSLTDASKEKVQAVLNITLKVLSVLDALKWLVPTKWQTAYTKTVDAVRECANSLTDLNVSEAELQAIRDKIALAIEAWKSPDDETCVDKV